MHVASGVLQSDVFYMASHPLRARTVLTHNDSEMLAIL